MKKDKLKGLIAGILIGCLLCGGSVYAISGTKTIDVTYRDIKVYKDGVLTNLVDGNGTKVEPFIYNGTTYLPVRGACQLAGMDVEWDGKTSSVYLWDEISAGETYFIEKCPPYDTSGCSTYLATEGDSFSMAGEKYSNGLAFNPYWDEGYALFNLNARYSTLEFTIGHTDSEQDEKSVSFIVDGKVIKTVVLEPECLPKKVTVPLGHGLQLKIQASDDCGHAIGLGNMIAR